MSVGGVYNAKNVEFILLATKLLVLSKLRLEVVVLFFSELWKNEQFWPKYGFSTPGIKPSWQTRPVRTPVDI